MYDWVTDMFTHLGGGCSHACSYCYVKSFHRCPAKYQGAPRMLEGALEVNFGAGKTIFMEHCGDLFADAIPEPLILEVLAHCSAFPANRYVFQTKNPARCMAFIDRMPPHYLLGTTIESDIFYPGIMGAAPAPEARHRAMLDLRWRRVATFVTVEPIMRFTLRTLAKWLHAIGPLFVNIGADSKRHYLPEPTPNEIRELIGALNGIEVRQKPNLARLLQ